MIAGGVDPAWPRAIRTSKATRLDVARRARACSLFDEDQVTRRNRERCLKGHYHVIAWVQPAAMDRLKRLVHAADDFQQRHRWLAFPVAVVKKFGEDQGGQRAALLAYYGFFSLFPLLLVAVTVLGFVLQGR